MYRTSIFYDINELFQFMDYEFKKFCTYFRINKLSLHTEKSKYLQITHKNNTIDSEHKIYIDNITLLKIINPKSLSSKEFPTVIRFLQ